MQFIHDDKLILGKVTYKKVAISDHESDINLKYMENLMGYYEIIVYYENDEIVNVLIQEYSEEYWHGMVQHCLSDHQNGFMDDYLADIFEDVLKFNRSRRVKSARKI